MLVVLVAACLPPVLPETGLLGGDTAVDSGDTGADTGADSGADSDTGTDTGTDTGATVVTVTVQNVVPVNDQMSTAHEISAVPAGSGRVHVDIQHYTNHGCATVNATATLDTTNGNIVVHPEVNDTCEPTIGLGIELDLVDVPLGRHGVSDGVATTEVWLE